MGYNAPWMGKFTAAGLKTITSPQNPLIRELLQIKKAPFKGAFLIEGPHLVEAALESGAALQAVLLSAGFLARYKEGEKGEFLDSLKRVLGARLFEAPGPLFNRLAETKTPQGILAWCSYEEVKLQALRASGPALIAISDGIKEPGNLGALIRAADAAGADACIVTPGSVSMFSPKTLRASAGSFFHLPVIEAGTEELWRYFREKKILLAGADAHAGKSLYGADLRAPVAIAFGSEAHGLSQEFLARADMLLRIPVRGRAESLNVGAAAAVFLFEAIRQRESSSPNPLPSGRGFHKRL